MRDWARRGTCIPARCGEDAAATGKPAAVTERPRVAVPDAGTAPGVRGARGPLRRRAGGRCPPREPRRELRFC